MSNKLLWLIVVLVVAGTVGLVIWAARQPQNTNVHLAQPVSAADWTQGQADAKAVLVEYGDFQCPACGQYYPIVKQVLADYKGKIYFAFRHFPLSQHPNAKPAAYAAETAGAQGKFWEMSDLLYTNQAAWSNLPDPTDTFVGYALGLKLDPVKFKADLSSGNSRAKVDAQYQSGISSGVSFTPSFFLNGALIQPANYDEFKGAIEAALKQ